MMLSELIHLFVAFVLMLVLFRCVRKSSSRTWLAVALVLIGGVLMYWQPPFRLWMIDLPTVGLFGFIIGVCFFYERNKAADE
ncbi:MULTISPECIES: hypothetical protein [Pseudomonas]|jgi:membrane protein CcdC involved in cytochrome C biogenesis|uniref:hypothetical protein n=1 Tax=Pseudomonas TaxID=286 RepID=UPI0002A29AF8|nr:MULTISPECIES: hypothetical protein [Pseudomonas]AMO78613.1 hypothetical protein PcP3B5_52300 [Pseudomonas citronellolis]KES20627.1 hypothetical protein FG99_28890 [Pseudomonas sp. AAC]KRV76044.1 hypothetical protein AO742_13235 [Pseudomonas citronellolis]KRW79974.1 hypothetical protein AO738_16695 [Pseudomonas citronellolis]KWR82999.1 hypothetical protein RN02_08235 [Pseudomonas sp. PI1]